MTKRWNIYFILKNNKNMRKFKQICLFLSSFAPLFILIIIKELIEIFNGNWSFNFLNTFLLVILFTLFNLGLFSAIMLLQELSVAYGNEVEVKSKTNITDQYFLGYFSLFVLFALSFEIEMYSMALIFFAILFLIGVVYIKNDIYYINPLINLLGYSFYNITIIVNGEQKEIRAFCKGKIECNKTYILCNKYQNFIMIKNK